MASDGSSVQLVDESTGTTYLLTISKATTLLDKSGQPLVVSELAVGDIVDAKYDKTNNQAVSISESATAWRAANKDNVQIDTSQQTITVGNDTYTYTDDLVTSYKGKPFSLDSVASIDVLSLSGVSTQVWTVQLITGHGSLYISDAGSIQNGVLEVDNDIYKTLDDSGDPIYLTEGDHKLVIKGDNIDPYSKDITIAANKSEYVSLDDAQLKTGVINVVVNIPNYTLYVDGTAQTSNGPVTVPYGSHTLRVEEDGYTPAEQTVDLEDTSLNVNINLEAILKLGKVIVDSLPEGAKIYIDSAYAGETPVNVSVEMGNHTLMITKDGYNSMSVPINVDKSVEPFNQYNFELTPQNLYTPPAQTPVQTYPYYVNTDEPTVYDPNNPSVAGPVATEPPGTAEPPQTPAPSPTLQPGNPNFYVATPSAEASPSSNRSIASTLGQLFEQYGSYGQ
jgi:hypothetical protein